MAEIGLCLERIVSMRKPTVKITSKGLTIHYPMTLKEIEAFKNEISLKIQVEKFDRKVKGFKHTPIPQVHSGVSFGIEGQAR